MKRQLGYTLNELLIVAFLLVVVVGGGIGWVLNIVKLSVMSFDPLTGLLVVRAVGIFVFPVGMIVGYF